MATYQLQLEVSDKWLDCGGPISDENEALGKFLDRVRKKTGDRFRLLRVEIYRETNPLFD